MLILKTIQYSLYVLFILVVVLYFYLDGMETYWPNIKSVKDFIDLFKLRTKQHFCRHRYIMGTTCMYCPKCFHTKRYE